MLLAGGGVPDPHRAVVAAAGQQLPAVDGDRAHRPDPALVAFQGGAFASRPDRSPLSPVGGFPAVGAVGGAQVIQRLGDAEQSRTLARKGGDGLGSQAQQPGTAAPACRGSMLSGLHEPPQVGMQQVRVIGEQIIDQPGSLRVARQGAQQVIGSPLPFAQPAERHERSRQRPLIIRPRGDISSRVQQGVVERLVEQPVHRHRHRHCDSRTWCRARLLRGSSPPKTGRTGSGLRR